MHWAWLDADLQDKIADNYVKGQRNNGSLKTKKWYAAIEEARMKLKEQERYGDD